MNVRDEERYYPDVEEALDVLLRGMGQPSPDDRHEEVEAYEHVDVPERGRIVVEVEDECGYLGESFAPSVSIHGYIRVTCGEAQLKVDEIEEGEEDGPGNEGDDNTLEAFLEKVCHVHSHRE